VWFNSKLAPLVTTAATPPFFITMESSPSLAVPPKSQFYSFLLAPIHIRPGIQVKPSKVLSGGTDLVRHSEGKIRNHQVANVLLESLLAYLTAIGPRKRCGYILGEVHAELSHSLGLCVLP